MVIVVLLAIVHVILPVALQRSVVHLVVYVLLHRHWHTVYTYLQCYHTLRCSVYVASVGSHASTWHTQQCRIFALAHGHAQYTICTRAPALVLETHLIHVHVFSASLGQQTLGGFQCRVASVGDGLLPESLKVLRHHRRWLQLLRTECCSACTLIVLAAHVCSHVHTIESGLLHGACQLQRAVLQHRPLLHVLIHLRSCSIVHCHILHQRPLLAYLYRVGSLLASIVSPVLVVGFHRHHHTVSAYLCL